MIAVEVVAVGGPAWVQDAGRPGWRAHGVPPGGALVPEGLEHANRGVGNPDGAAAIELYGPVTVVARGGPLLLATHDEARVLADGEAWAVAAPAPWRVRYLAVRGGLDVPRVLGGSGTLPAAGLGGLEGRALRGGDLLPVGLPGPLVPRLSRRDRPCALPADAPLPLLLGPGPLPAAALGLLTRAWRVGAGDRTGTPLEGEPLPTDSAGTEGSRVAWRGLVQLPHGGTPVVLGPDHPTTGGYPALAELPPRVHGSFAARPPGAPLHLYAAPAAPPRG